MALAITKLTTGTQYDTANSATYSTESISPSANSLLIASFAGTYYQDAATPVVSGFGSSGWDLIQWSRTASGLYLNLGCWYLALGESPGSDTVDWAGGDALANCVWEVAQITGYDTGDPIGSNAMSTWTNTGTTKSVTIPTFDDAGSYTFATALAVSTTAAPVLTKDADFTATSDISYLDGHYVHFISQYDDVPDTTPLVNKGLSSAWCNIIGVEIKPAAGAGGDVSDPFGMSGFFGA